MFGREIIYSFSFILQPDKAHGALFLNLFDRLLNEAILVHREKEIIPRVVLKENQSKSYVFNFFACSGMGRKQVRPESTGVNAIGYSVATANYVFRMTKKKEIKNNQVMQLLLV